MKKLISIIPLLAGILMAGCTADEPAPAALDAPAADEIKMTESSEFVTEDEVNSVISSFMGMPASRAEEGMRNISLIKGKKNTPAYYIVNIADDGGFYLVSATKNYTPILAYSTTGNFTAEAYTTPGIADWLIDITAAIDEASEAPDSIKDQAHTQWSALNAQIICEPTKAFPLSRSAEIGDRNNHPELIPIMEDSIASWRSKGWEVYYFEDYNFTNPSRDEMIQNMQSAADWRYIEDAAALTLIVRKTTFWSSGATPNLNGIRWNQPEPWNYSFPLLSNGQRAVAGCMPVAVGQFMYYSKYPTTFNWDAMRPTYATKETQDFLFLLADKMNATYKGNNNEGRSTEVYSSDMLRVVKSYGYTVSETDKLDKAGFPCIVTSRIKAKDQEEGGHAYLLCGYSSTQSTESVECWTFTKKNSLNACYQLEYNTTSSRRYYINWGWGGYCDGSYVQPETKVPNSNYDYNIINRYYTPRH